jgi:hypothetical protein
MTKPSGANKALEAGQMTLQGGVSGLAVCAIAIGGMITFHPREASAAMCSASPSCGLCCYYADPGNPVIGDLNSCCDTNECFTECDVEETFCCQPDGFEIVECQ